MMRLDQLTLHDLIELSCGNYAVLGEGDELALVKQAASIMDEYKSIAAPTQSKMDMMDAEKKSKYDIKDKCARICILLCIKGRSDLARELLIKLGVGEEHLATEESIKARCEAIIGEVEYETERLAQRKSKKARMRSAEQTRREWYSEIASVMGVFRMNIDPEHTNAAIYANLVAQAVERNKALAKMPPSARMFM